MYTPFNYTPLFSAYCASSGCPVVEAEGVPTGTQVTHLGSTLHQVIPALYPFELEWCSTRRHTQTKSFSAAGPKVVGQRCTACLPQPAPDPAPDPAHSPLATTRICSRHMTDYKSFTYTRRSL